MNNGLKRLQEELEGGEYYDDFVLTIPLGGYASIEISSKIDVGTIDFGPAGQINFDITEETAEVLLNIESIPFGEALRILARNAD